MLTPKYQFRQSCLLLGLAFAPFYLSAREENADTRIQNLITDADALAKGQAIYQSMCFSCHGKNLEGATGFNLKDGEWVHGSSPSEIVANIKRGFPEKGMLAFEGIYDEPTIEATVAYILSRAEGLRNLSYKIYEKSPDAGFGFDTIKTLTPVSDGAIASGIAKPELSELANYAMLFEGELLANAADNPRLEIETNARTWLKLEIDGAEINQQDKRPRSLSQPLKAKQTIRLLLVSDNPNAKLRLALHSDKGITPLSTASIEYLTNTSFLRTAEQRPLVIRTSIDQLPAKSIAVIHSQGIGYAIHAPTGAIVGLWIGNALNIGPNIAGRGTEPSRPEGEWLLHDPTGLALVINGKPTSFALEKYSRDSAEPIFTSASGKYRIQMTATPAGDNSLQIRYTFIGPKPKSVALSIPPGMAIASGDGTSSENRFQVANDKRSAFTLTLSR